MENGKRSESEEYKRLLKFIEMKNAEPCPYEGRLRGGETRGGKRMPVEIVWHDSKENLNPDYFEAATITVDRSYLYNMFYHILPKGRSANRYPCLHGVSSSRFNSFLRVSQGTTPSTSMRESVLRLLCCGIGRRHDDISNIWDFISSDPSLSPQEKGFIGVFRSLNCQGQRELLFCIDIRISRYFLLTLNDSHFKLLIKSLGVNGLVSVLGKFLPTIHGNKFDIARGLVVNIFLGMSESDFKSSYSYAFREEARSYGEWGDVMDEILTKRRSKETASEIPKEDPDFCKKVSYRDNLRSFGEWGDVMDEILTKRRSKETASEIPKEEPGFCEEVSYKDNLRSLLCGCKAYCLEPECLPERGVDVQESEGSVEGGIWCW